MSTIYIRADHRGRSTVFAGSIDYLVNKIFNYTLDCGHSWNKRIQRYPKSAKSLVKALNASATECRNYSDFYTETTEELAKNHGWTIITEG